MHAGLTSPQGLARFDLLVLGLLLCWALWLRVVVADALVLEPAFAFGPDGDDWAGVFRGTADGWPLRWEGEWSYKYPLLPLLSLGVAGLAEAPVAFGALWVNLLTGALLAPLTYAFGRPLVGRPAALAAAGWMVVQDGLAAHSVLTTAYALIPTATLLMLLGMSLSLRGRPRSGAVATIIGTAALMTTVLHGGALALVTLGAAALFPTLALIRTPRDWRPLWRLAWPVGAGLALGRLGLFSHEMGDETPGLGALIHLYEEVAQTAFHDPTYGSPTGHQVDRLVAGMSRWEHLQLANWELYNLPIVVVLPLAIAGIVAVALLMRREPRLAAARALLLVMLPGVVYGFVANSEDFHVFQWTPALALVLCAGVGAWWLLRDSWVARIVCGAGALALLLWQSHGVPALQAELLPRLRYDRVWTYYVENDIMRRICAGAVGPVSVRGTLMVQDPMVWGYRANLHGAHALAGATDLAPPVDPDTLEPPVYLVGAQPEDAERWRFLLALHDQPGSAALFLRLPAHGLPGDVEQIAPEGAEQDDGVEIGL